jgi:hypothetical protein
LNQLWVAWPASNCGTQKSPNFVAGDLVGLSVGWQMNGLDRTMGEQPGSDFCSSMPSGGITIQHENYALEAIEEQELLRGREGRPHQCDHRTNTGLVQLEPIEETSTTTTAGFSAAAARWKLNRISDLANPGGNR